MSAGIDDAAGRDARDCMDVGDGAGFSELIHAECDLAGAEG